MSIETVAWLRNRATRKLHLFRAGAEWSVCGYTHLKRVGDPVEPSTTARQCAVCRAIEEHPERERRRAPKEPETMTAEFVGGPLDGERIHVVLVRDGDDVDVLPRHYTRQPQPGMATRA
jgi:hypothetical protein